MKTEHPVHITVFGVVTSDANIPHPFILPHGLRLNIRGLHQVSGRISSALDQEVDYLKTLYLTTRLCAITHKQEILILAVRKFPCPLTSGHPNSLNCNSLDDYMRDTIE